MSATHKSTEVELWHTYRTELVRFVLKRVRDEALAEDIVHDVFVKAHTRSHDLKEASRLRPWLYQITRNALVDHYRSQRPLELLPEDLIHEGENADESAEQELALCLRPLIDGLPASYREALTLAELDGMPQAEIAARVGLSLSGAKSRVQRARTMLREVLLQCCRVEVDKRGGVVDYEPAKGCTRCEDPAVGQLDPDPSAPAHCLPQE